MKQKNKNISIVQMDGSWSKAGFSSNFGFAVVLSARTGKVLDYHFLSKYCNRCAQKKSKGELEEGHCGDCRVGTHICHSIIKHARFYIHFRSIGFVGDCVSIFWYYKFIVC